MTIAVRSGSDTGPVTDRRRQPQVHLGRRVAHQDRREGQGLRRRQQRLPGRGSGHRPRAAQDADVCTCRTSRPRSTNRAQDEQAMVSRDLARYGGARVARARSSRSTGSSSPSSRSRRRRRASSSSILQHRAPAAGRPRDLRAVRAGAGARHGAPDPHAGRRRAAHRRGRPRPDDRRAHGRRARGARRPLQPHDRRSCASRTRASSARWRSARASSPTRSSSRRRSARSCA